SSLTTVSGRGTFRWLSKATGIFSGMRILWIVIPLTGALTAAGFWAGTEWSDGKHAISEMATLDQRLDRLDKALKRNDESARRFEQTRSYISQYYRQHDDELRLWSAANRERLVDCGIGPDGLHLWNLW